MYEKLKSGGNLPDHELLEILLFSAVSRKNTNGLAHRLIDTFGSLSGVFSAGAEELKSVEGVGEGVANFLICTGECMRRAHNRAAGVVNINNYGELKKFVRLRMRGKTEETLEVYFLSKTGKIKSVFSYTSENLHKINISSAELQEKIVLAKPYGLVAAHNHVEGEALPSLDDDNFTKTMQLICSLGNIILYDHLIYSDDEVYSYNCSGKIDEIKRYTYDRLIKIADNSALPLKKKYG